MSGADLQIKEMSIVLLGSFNPVIFQPSWMANKGIIQSSEADNAELMIIHKEVTEFALEYCEMQIFLDRFIIRSRHDTYFSVVKDIAISIFTELRETPVYQMGINLEHHYRFLDELEWHHYGHKHAPKEQLWDNIVNKPGLRSINIQSQRDDGYEGNVNISTGISNIPKVGDFRIRIGINDHYDFNSASNQSDKSDVNAVKAIDVLTNNWTTNMDKLEKIIKGVLDYGTS